MTRDTLAAAIAWAEMIVPMQDDATHLRTLIAAARDGPMIPDGRFTTDGEPVPTSMRDVLSDYAMAARAEADEVDERGKRIAALTARVAELEAALREIVTTDESFDGKHRYAAIARAALKGKA